MGKRGTEQVRRVTDGSRSVEYMLSRKRVKNINLRVRADGSLAVSASRRVPLSAIDTFVRSQMDFIERARKRISARQEAKRRFWEEQSTEQKKEIGIVVIDRKKALALLDEICQKFYPVIEPYGIAYPELKVRDMKASWGICRPTKGCITFSLRLAAMPRECVEYVVLHELAHFIHPNHSGQFYSFVERYMPDWKARREKLRLGER